MYGPMVMFLGFLLMMLFGIAIAVIVVTNNK